MSGRDALGARSREAEASNARLAKERQAKAILYYAPLQYLPRAESAAKARWL